MSLAQLPAPPLADTPLGRTIATTATDIWNDSCALDELEYAISFGAVGATANPTIVTDVWKKEPALWRGRVRELANERRTASEADLAWAIVDEMSVRAAPLLMPAFEAHGGRQGRLSTQTDPTLHRSAEAMLSHGLHFVGLAPNIILLIVFRVLQGVGGGMILPLGQQMMAEAAGPKRMGRVMSIMAVPVMLAPSVLPTWRNMLTVALAIPPSSWGTLMTAAAVLGGRISPAPAPNIASRPAVTANEVAGSCVSISSAPVALSRRPAPIVALKPARRTIRAATELTMT